MIESILKVVTGIVKLRNSTGTVIDPATETTLSAMNTKVKTVDTGAVAITNFLNGAPLGTKTNDGYANPISSIVGGNAANALSVAQAATDFVSSVLNSSTAQLASGATYTGGIETVFNQQSFSILVISDQPGTLTINQYIDQAGNYLVSTISFPVSSTAPFARSGVLNGNFARVTYKNTGLVATTTLNINTSYGTIPAATQLNNEPVSINEVNGIAASARPDGFLRTTTDPSTLIYDTFETFDTANTWTPGGTVIPTLMTGGITFQPGTAANATSYMKTIPTFAPGSSAYLQYAAIIQLETGAPTGSQRFWGLGVYTTPTAAVPITNGSIYEIDRVTGNLYASVYSGSVRTQTTYLTRPTDGLVHRYSIYYKGTRVYYEIDNVVVATFSNPNPQVSLLSCVMGVINGSTALTAAPWINTPLVGLGDTARNNIKISDGKFPWRNATVLDNGRLAVATSDENGTTLGRSFTAIIDSIGVATTTESNAMLLINPAGSGKILKFRDLRFSTPLSSGQYFAFRMYLNPTATANGTALTPIGSRQTNQSAATCTVYQSPTVSSKGTIFRSIRVSGGGNDVVAAENYSIWLEPGNRILITVQASGLALTANLTAVYVEE